MGCRRVQGVAEILPDLSSENGRLLPVDVIEAPEVSIVPLFALYLSEAPL